MRENPGKRTFKSPSVAAGQQTMKRRRTNIERPLLIFEINWRSDYREQVRHQSFVYSSVSNKNISESWHPCIFQFFSLLNATSLQYPRLTSLRNRGFRNLGQHYNILKEWFRIFSTRLSQKHSSWEDLVLVKCLTLTAIKIQWQRHF